MKTFNSYPSSPIVTIELSKTITTLISKYHLSQLISFFEQYHNLFDISSLFNLCKTCIFIKRYVKLIKLLLNFFFYI